MSPSAVPPQRTHSHSRPRLSLAQLDAALRGRLVVSCQPVDGGPLDDDDVVARIAQAAVAGGAAALRIEGAARLARVRAAVQVPLLGIVKRDLPDSPVRITPWLTDVQALAAAGADVIAIDATARARPFSVAALHEAISAQGVLAMADCAAEVEALAAWAQGFAIVGSTLSGYTGAPHQPVPEAPDLALVQRLAAAGCRVMAEGRYDTPALAASALAAGAWAVTVGSAITRLEVVTGRFADALLAARGDASTRQNRVNHERPKAKRSGNQR
jgi:N-acylglucosamine-6-phosphate 2-epimerase